MRNLVIALFAIALIIFIVYAGKIIYRYQMYDIAVINTNANLIMTPLDNMHFITGDLIWFRYDCSKCTNQEYINMIIACNPWPSVFSHVGMVINLDGIPYIAHKTYCEQLDIHGNCMVNKSGLYPLHKYIKEYKGHVYHTRIRQHLNEGQINILREQIDTYNSKPFIVDAVTVFDYLCKTDIKSRKNSTMSCSGYVHNLMADIGKLKPTNGNHTTPSGVYNEIVKFGLYEHPVIIMNDYLFNR